MADTKSFSKSMLTNAQQDNLAAGKPVLSTYFTWHGGRILSNARVALVFVGTYDTTIKYNIIQFFRDLPSSTWFNVLSQYGVNSATLSGYTNLSAPSTSLSQKQVWQLVTAAKSKVSADLYILCLGAGVGASFGGAILCGNGSGGGNAFGDHDHFWHWFSDIPYAVVPYLLTPCVQKSCLGGDATCSLKSTQTQQDRLTQVLSHEFAEACTDPICSPDTTGWSAGTGSWENGDICNGESASISLFGRTWNVQPIYSKRADDAGKPYCASTSITKLPAYPRSDFWAHWTNFWARLYRFFSDNLSYWL